MQVGGESVQGGGGGGALDEGTRARAPEGATRVVAVDKIRLGLDHEARAFPPDELGADEVFCALQRIDLEKGLGQHVAKLAAQARREIRQQRTRV